jgi:hypothetical protein
MSEQSEINLFQLTLVSDAQQMGKEAKTKKTKLGVT